MAERAVALENEAQKCTIHTFHSFGARFLRYHALAAGLDPNFTVYDDDDAATLLAKAAPNIRRRQEAGHFAHVISLAKDYCLDADDEALSHIDSDARFPAIYRAYQERLGETGNVDFGDLIQLPVKVLENNPAVRDASQNRYRIILVDEYQDSNVAQFRLLRALAGPNTAVCVVGDDDQSIYHFRGAEVENILGFQDHFPGTTVIRLEQNYRSVSPVLTLADSIVSKNTGRLGKTLRPVREGGKKPKLIFLDNQDDEASFCAALVEQAHEKGAPYKDWAILYRMNAQSLGFETEFLRKQIPYQVVGALKFYEREEIKDALSILAFLANPRDEVAFARMVNKPPRGIGAVTLAGIVSRTRAEGASYLAECQKTAEGAAKKTAKGLRDFTRIMEGLSTELHRQAAEGERKHLSDFIAMATELTGLLDYHKERDEITGTTRRANLQELANSAIPYPHTVEGLLEFLDTIELDRTLDSGEAPKTDGVTLITLHNTKGLEFPRVIITGMESGIFPRTDKSGDDLEEERRLFYVGITRAKDEIYLTACAQRRIYGHTSPMFPSPFLYELDRSLFSMLGKEFDLTIIAALLTVMGYSLNDTIIIYDRIRENLYSGANKKSRMDKILNLSVNQTLSRTAMTSITTLMVAAILIVMGGGIVNDFALVMFIGIVVGTYSSVFFASPILLLFEKTIARQVEKEKEEREKAAIRKRDRGLPQV
jgi:DNA helicase-2/ATP-dependent DNA helicase PcrA